MANPDYATLLPQIAKETDAVKKQALIDECYQFIEPLTLEERSLFSYTTPDYDNNDRKDYVTDNPGLVQGNVYVSYTGIYYNEYAQNTGVQDNNIYGGPFFIYGTGKTGFGEGKLGYFYPLYTDITYIIGSYHIHTFEEYKGYTFYMPDSEMNHAIQNPPDDMFEYGDFDVTLTGLEEETAPIIVVEYTPPPQEEAPAEEEEEEVVTTTQTVAIALPSTDGSTSNYGGITGLSITRETTTTTSVGGFDQLGATVVGTSGTILSPPSFSNAQGNPTRLARVRNLSTGAQPVIERIEHNFGSSPQLTSEESNNANIASGSVSSSVSVPGNSLLYFKVRFSGAGGPSDQRVSTEVQSLTTTSTTTYSFTNNTGYPVTIEGTTLANGAGPTEITISGDVDVTYTSES